MTQWIRILELIGGAAFALSGAAAAMEHGLDIFGLHHYKQMPVVIVIVLRAAVIISLIKRNHNNPPFFCLFAFLCAGNVLAAVFKAI